MSLQTFVLLLSILPGEQAIPEVPALEGALPAIEIGLSAPIERLVDADSFAQELAGRVIWRVASDDEDGEPAAPVRFTAVRIERGRVTASYQSDRVPASNAAANVADAIGAAAFVSFHEKCFTPEDPPAEVRALSGKRWLDAEGSEQAVAEVARTGRLDVAYGLDHRVEIEWGRQIVLILAGASEDAAARVRPLILVLERV